MINENNGTNETNTSFKISDLGGISSAAGFGASEEFKYALYCHKECITLPTSNLEILLQQKV